MTVHLKRHLFTVEDYHRMADAGVLTEDDRVELLNGEILEMPPISSYHASCVKRLSKLFNSRLGRRAIVSIQDPILVDDLSEPEPDVALLRPQEDYYAEAHPAPEDVLLLVEVAYTALPFDRDTKLPIYARSGIAETWLVDLNEECIYVYANPAPQGYREMRTYWRGDVLAADAFPDVTFLVDEILGRPAR